MAVISLDLADLALAALLLVLNGALSLLLQLGLGRSLLIAAVRMVAQLGLMGLVLEYLFASRSPWLTLLAALVMIAFAGQEIFTRQRRRLRGGWTWSLGAGAMLLAAGVVTVFALTTQLRPDPWYDPRYAIPLLGMILGNTMTGIALGLNTLTEQAYASRAAIEARLALGDDSRLALRPVVQGALATALTPIVNTMAVTGVVSLPGMMTGQILAGAPPLEAVKYQILILFLVAGGTALGASCAVLGAAARLTDPRQRLRLDRLQAPDI